MLVTPMVTLQLQLCHQSPRDPAGMVGGHWLGGDRADPEPFNAPRPVLAGAGQQLSSTGCLGMELHLPSKIKQCCCSSGLLQMWAPISCAGAVPSLPEPRAPWAAHRLHSSGKGSSPLSSPCCAFCRFLMMGIKHELHCSAG